MSEQKSIASNYKWLAALIVLIGIVFLLWATLYGAELKGTPNPEASRASDKFSEMDKDKDGKVVLEEFQASYPGMNQQAFVVIDRNGDGAIQRAEWIDFINQHGSGQKPDLNRRGAPMNNIPGDPLIPPPNSSDLPLVRPPAGM